jgi:hypothetical protein
MQDEPVFIFESSQGGVSVVEANSLNAYKSHIVVKKESEPVFELKPGQFPRAQAAQSRFARRDRRYYSAHGQIA